MKVLVTGAAGFLGGECVRQLRAAGHDVVTTDRHGAVDHAGDLADGEFIHSLPGVDTVVHCAAVQYLSPDLPLFGRSRYFQRNNVLATSRLVRRYAGTGTHFVFVGSSMMYAQGLPGACTPDSPMRAQGAYSASKIAAWRAVSRAGRACALVLPCIIAGPGRGGLFRPFVESIRRFGVAVFPGRADHPVHVVHVEDVAALIAAVVGQRATGLFNAASDEPLSIRQWAREIADELGAPAPRTFALPLAPIRLAARLSGYRLMAAEQLLMLRHPHVLDTASSRSLGWQARWSNTRIIRETAQALVRKTGREVGGGLRGCE